MCRKKGRTEIHALMQVSDVILQLSQIMTHVDSNRSVVRYSSIIIKKKHTHTDTFKMRFSTKASSDCDR